MNLLSLASRQIWPHVLTVAHLEPQRVVLLHSDDPQESKGPAQRLKRLFDKTELLPKGGTRLALLPHNDFDAAESALDNLKLATHELPDTVMNFTGGNKLMATAAFRWAARRGVRSFYLERGSRITWFDPRDGDVHTSTSQLDGHVADDLDPVALLRCQLDASEVERKGQTLTAGKRLGVMDGGELQAAVRAGDAEQLLEIEGSADRKDKEGDPLELSAAAALLALGVRRVQRSLRLKVKSAQGVSTSYPHQEIDLLFTWGGRLWIVDCKDQRSVENLADALKETLPADIPPPARSLLDRIRDELTIGHTKALKEDLLAVRETGGLLGKIVAVRRQEMPSEAEQYARHNRIELVYKHDLVGGFRRLLFPDSAADPDDIAGLAAAWKGR